MASPPRPPPSPALLFVYGTLEPGFSNAAALPLGVGPPTAATTAAPVVLVLVTSYAIPFLLPPAPAAVPPAAPPSSLSAPWMPAPPLPGHRVRGVVVPVTADALAVLDDCCLRRRGLEGREGGREGGEGGGRVRSAPHHWQPLRTPAWRGPPVYSGRRGLLKERGGQWAPG